ncbi:MAG: agmatine deiminase family protein [Oligoflexales bacterium]|nr:agmatine deiminase family protein [Oligoflexales bacterium]
MPQKKLNTSLPSLVFCAILCLSACSGENSPRQSLYDAFSHEDPPLPNWATEKELEKAKQEDPSDTPPTRVTPPPPSGFRVPAEYEPMQAVALGFAGYQSMLKEIARHVSAAGVKVLGLEGPSNLPDVPKENYEALDFPINSVWIRDYGPFGIDEQSGKLGIIDSTYRHYQYRKEDDAVPCKLAARSNAACYSTSLILDGGNFLTDGKGSLFMTGRTYEWNSKISREKVDLLLKDYYGIKKIHLFDYPKTSSGNPADGTGHIDMFVKLLGECKVLVAESSDDEFRNTLEKAAAYFEGLPCIDERSYEVYRIKGWKSNGTWYTYTNSLIVNKTVIIPSYKKGDNEVARQIYQKALPDYKTVLLPSDDSITSGGSIHCVTKEIPITSSGPLL